MSEDTPVTVTVPDRVDEEGFLFPFQPYRGQVEFCNTLYNAALSRKLAILESPTGTGKSMAIIASALRWLVDSEARFHSDFDAMKAEDIKLSEEDDWLAVADKRRKVQDAMSDIKTITDWLDESEKLAHESLSKMIDLESRLKQKNDVNIAYEDAQKVEAGVKEKPIESNSDEFIGSSSEDEENDDPDGLSKRFGPDSLDFPAVPQIIYASRTHSQLSQFVNEMGRHPTKVRAVPLGARQMLCINENVRSSSSSGWLVNDRCAELRKRKGAKGCRFYNKQRINTLSNSLLGKVTDIEDLAVCGRSACACPYYAARRAIPRAQALIIPYPLLFQTSARESSGIRITGALVIIDEAHNLLEHLADAHAARVDQNQLQAAQQLLAAYWDRYGTRLNAVNARMVRQLSTMVTALVDHLVNRKKAQSQNASVFKVEEFAFSAGAEAINLPALVRWAKSVRIGQKVRSFSSSLFSSLPANDEIKSEKGSKGKEKEETPQSFGQASALCQVLSFLETLGNLPNPHTRVIVTDGNETEKKPPSIHVLLLDPASQFATILKEARAVVLAGGTMQPVGDLIDQLNSSVPNLQVICKQFPHVIPSESLMIIPVSTGPSGQRMRFTFAARQDTSVLKEAGKALASLMPLVPHGFVVFFPSYDLLSSATELWRSDGSLERLERKKKIFVEPRNSRHGVEQFLDEYAEMAKTNQGAILFAVIGGKLSEGVNLADDLARGLAVIGMPYPSLASVELQEKLRFLSGLKPLEASSCEGETERDRGRRYYTSLCWRAINQTVGRCIRHANDHAVVYLLDERYASKTTLDANLPRWMAPSIVRPVEGAGSASFGMVISSTASFFKKQRASKLASDSN